ncbi:uncharacterized protein LOC123546628 [Mercenaria mercenaria]|uniref:uncharacterized protein LOC123546628 n=1 Tax=Mercenaria mercenaria TaxID=6596 RepID=UPI001E1D3F73|nr:uncharacterized protein LOC123546628 [Mercenaria mercenaria]
MATQTLSRIPPIAGDKARMSQQEDSFSPSKQTQSPVYIPPNEFRMKLLKRILSVDGTIDNKALHKLQKSSSERTLQANILFQNGDVGTLISFDRLSDDSEKKDSETKEDSEQGLPSLKPEETEKQNRPKDGVKRERPLKLPPIMLPPVYTLTPRPLILRDYSGPPLLPPPTREEDWEDLEDCRYLRPAKKQFKTTNDGKSFLLSNGGSG